MKKLIIIYGAPRTGTTHLLNTLLLHPECCGINDSGDKSLDTNEPINIPYTGPPDDTETLDMLWEHWYEEGKRYLVLKAPGFCWGWDYFSGLKEYECKYIYTDRSAIEVVESLLSNSVARDMINTGDARSGGCPEGLVSVFEPLWQQSGELDDFSRIVSRMYYIYRWHRMSVPDAMASASLQLIPYRSRLNATIVANLLLTYLDFDRIDGDWYGYLKTFHYRQIGFEMREFLRSKIHWEGGG